MLQVDELELDKCYQITVTVTAVNEMGKAFQRFLTSLVMVHLIL